jgi:hypothetical protein
MHRKKAGIGFSAGLVFFINARLCHERGRQEPAPMTKPGRTSGAGPRTMIY